MPKCKGPRERRFLREFFDNLSDVDVRVTAECEGDCM